VSSFPFLLQQNEMDCGPTCLYMISKYYGRTFSIEKLRELTEIGKAGVNILGISDAAEKTGYRTQAAQLNIAELESSNLPAILHWNQQHFVVLYKIRKQIFFIADPGTGLVKLTRQEFEKRWISSVTPIDNPALSAFGESHEPVGLALFLEPGPAFFNNVYHDDFTATPAKGFGSIVKYLYPYKQLIFQVMLGLLLGSLLQLVFPFLTQSIVDTGINTGNIHFITIILFAQLALFAGRLSVPYQQPYKHKHTHRFPYQTDETAGKLFRQ